MARWNNQTLLYGSERPRIGMFVLGHLLVHSLICLHRSLIVPSMIILMLHFVLNVHHMELAQWCKIRVVHHLVKKASFTGSVVCTTCFVRMLHCAHSFSHLLTPKLVGEWMSRCPSIRLFSTIMHWLDIACVHVCLPVFPSILSGHWRARKTAAISIDPLRCTTFTIPSHLISSALICPYVVALWFILSYFTFCCLRLSHIVSVFVLSRSNTRLLFVWAHYAFPIHRVCFCGNLILFHLRLTPCHFVSFWLILLF